MRTPLLLANFIHARGCNINTTRIYTRTSGEEHLWQSERLHLIL